MKLAAPLFALLLMVSAVAQTAVVHLVAPERVTRSGGAVTIRGDQLEDSFIPGLGWSSGSSAPQPILEGEHVYLDPENLQRLGLPPHPVSAPEGAGETPPLLPDAGLGVRFGGDAEVRIVVDLPRLASEAPLQSLERQGRLDEGEILSLQLPVTEAPTRQRQQYRGFAVEFREVGDGVRLELSGPASSYRVFSLEDPTRLVIDAVPLLEEPIDPEVRVLREGVTYRTFAAHTPAGQSRVHLLEFAPRSGEFRVVGTSEVPRTLSELADGAFAAINAGYFDTSTFQAIGLLRVDYGLQSLPSRNRASVGFGIGGPVIDRVRVRVDLRIGGRVYRRESGTGSAGGVEISTVAGALAGSPYRGALVVEHGRIVANRVGPVRVPENGFVVSYPADDRELALVDPGVLGSLSVDFEPDEFQIARYAVEAGPLLIEGGRPAFEPNIEHFSRGERILDAYTQQSAIGIRPDGTVLFVVAETMRAQDLVPLFLSLGASSAMRLDSGSSSTLLAAGEVLNRASERRIVSAIVYLPKGS